MLIAMAGRPGAGKTTIVEQLVTRLGEPVVSVDPVPRLVGAAGAFLRP